MLLCDSPAGGSNFRLRLRKGDIWLEPPDRGDETREPCRGRLKEEVRESRRNPECDFLREGEVARHDADNTATPLTQLDLATDNLRIASETLLPARIAQDDNARRAVF